MPGYGIAGHFGLAKEATWGTAVAATHYAEILSEGVVPTLERADLANIVARYSEPDDMATLYRVAGPVSMVAWPNFVGHMLRGACGVTSTTITVSATQFTSHIFTLGSSDFATNVPYPPYTLEVFRDVGSSLQLDGCVVETLDIDVNAGQPVLFNPSFIGRSFRYIAKTTPTFAGSPTQPFAFDTASFSVGGSLNQNFETLRISLQNQNEGVATLVGTNTIGKIRRTGPQLVRISGTLGFEDTTEHLNFINQTEQRMFLNLTRAASFSLLLDLPRVVYTTFPIGMGGRGRTLVNFEGIARYHTGSTNAFKATLTNVVTAY
jgi:hypothetical protein